MKVSRWTKESEGGIILLVSWFPDRLRMLSWRKREWKTSCVCVCVWERERVSVWERRRGRERERERERDWAQRGGICFLQFFGKMLIPHSLGTPSNSFLFYACFILFYYFCPISTGGEHVKMTSAVRSVRVATSLRTGDGMKPDM